MKSTVDQLPPPCDASLDVKLFLYHYIYSSELIQAKKEFYRDCLKDDFVKWKCAKYPVDDARPIVYSFMQWFYSTPIDMAAFLRTKCHANEALEIVLHCGLDVFKVVQEVVELLYIV